jgi:hypothetical protein
VHKRLYYLQKIGFLSGGGGQCGNRFIYEGVGITVRLQVGAEIFDFDMAIIGTVVPIAEISVA